MKLEAGQLAQPWWELCQGYAHKAGEALMHITPPSPAEPRNQISAMTLVSTGIRQRILSCTVLRCYEWTFMLDPYSSEAREGLRCLQVNLSLWQTPCQPCPSLARSLALSGVFCAITSKGWGPFGVDGSPFVGAHPRWVDIWHLSAGRGEIKEIHHQNSCASSSAHTSLMHLV